MNLHKKIAKREAKIAVTGLGYVGLPLAVAFSRRADVIGFDVDTDKIEQYKKGIDPSNEIGDEAVKRSSIEFTADETKLSEAKFHIVAVPTPINADKTPDLSLVSRASMTIGRNLSRGAIVVYESTVYPGITEGFCIPILEKQSGLKCGIDFRVGYSPERINPGDKIHRLENITKIVSGIDKESLEEIAKIYEMIISAGVHRASSIKVAEAAKVAENAQRDINIAFMNELAMVFHRMDIDTSDVIEAMNTKWNALGFYPGLVGGHCIAVDPYYFLYEAEKLGYHSQIILAGRKINDGMGEFVADAIIRQLVLANKIVKEATIVILGVTYKENCADIRNSKVANIIAKLEEYGIKPIVVDPRANTTDAKHKYGVDLAPLNRVKNADCLVFAVAHDEFQTLSWDQIDSLFGEFENDKKIIVDVRSMLCKTEIDKRGYRYWRL